MTEAIATAAGQWPGSDVGEACRTILGELGSPQLPILPLLPDRGTGAEKVGRTAAMLVDLPVDVQSFGWRLVQRPGADERRARSYLASDVNVLADVVGALESPVPRIKTQLLGPFSLAAALHLPLGEKVLSDRGARRELAASLSVGIGLHLAALRQAVPGAEISLQIDEPAIEEVLAGSVPTASGYRTMRAVPAAEVRMAWNALIEAVHAAGSTEVLFSVPAVSTPQVMQTSADAIALLVDPARPLSTSDWESLAGLVESGKSVQLPVSRGGAGKAAEQVWRLWRDVGLPAGQLGALRLVESVSLANLSPEAARRVLGELADTAEALNELGQAG